MTITTCVLKLAVPFNDLDIYWRWHTYKRVRITQSSFSQTCHQIQKYDKSVIYQCNELYKHFILPVYSRWILLNTFLTKSIQWSYLQRTKYFGRPFSDKVNSVELPSAYQVLWSAIFWQSQLSYLQRILWSAIFWQSQLSYLQCIKYFGRPFSDKVKSVELPSAYTLVGNFLTKSNQWSYLQCIKYFVRPFSVRCPVYRNVSDKGCLLLASISKGWHLFCKFRMTFTWTKGMASLL